MISGKNRFILFIIVICRIWWFHSMSNVYFIPHWLSPSLSSYLFSLVRENYSVYYFINFHWMFNIFLFAFYRPFLLIWSWLWLISCMTVSPLIFLCVLLALIICWQMYFVWFSILCWPNKNKIIIHKNVIIISYISQ